MSGWGYWWAQIEWSQPWAWVLLPLPGLVYVLCPPYRQPQTALRVPFFAEAAQAVQQKPQLGAVVWPLGRVTTVVHLLVWALFVLALARPQWVQPPLTKVLPARDLLLAVDLSPSMRAIDFTLPNGQRVNRLEAVQKVLDEFIARRTGDRIGLLVFGEQPFVQAPLTLDHAAVRALLAQTRIGMAGDRTMIGDAIGLAIRLFEDSRLQHRTVILLTDGSDTGSQVPPAKAAEIAARKGVTIHTVAIGALDGAGEFRVDQAALQQVAALTGGRSFRGEDRTGLQAIYRELDRLERTEYQTLSVRPRQPLWFWPLGTALAALAGWHLLVALGSAAMGLCRRWLRRGA